MVVESFWSERGYSVAFDHFYSKMGVFCLLIPNKVNKIIFAVFGAEKEKEKKQKNNNQGRSVRLLSCTHEESISSPGGPHGASSEPHGGLGNLGPRKCHFLRFSELRHFQ